MRSAASNETGVRRPTAFAAFAGDDLPKWELLVGCEVAHRDYGIGRVLRVYESDYGLRLRVYFDRLETTPERNFPPDAFLEGRIHDVELPSTMGALVTFVARSENELLDRQVEAEHNLSIEEQRQKEALAELSR